MRLDRLLGERWLPRNCRRCHRQPRRSEFLCADHRGVGGVTPPLGLPPARYTAKARGKAGVIRLMGYNARNDEIDENLERMRREREAYEDALAIVRQFNARLSAKKTAWFWPTIGAALASKHHWLIIACDACDTSSTRSDYEAPRSRCADPHCPQRC